MSTPRSESEANQGSLAYIIQSLREALLSVLMKHSSDSPTTHIVLESLGKPLNDLQRIQDQLTPKQ